VPVSPKPRCRICKQLHCTDPAHKRQPRQRTGSTSERRPEYNSHAERKRRALAVKQFLSQHGHTLDNGDVIARCLQCHELRAHFVADHVVPMIQGGSESGDLRVHCARCSGQQGAKLAGKRKRSRR